MSEQRPHKDLSVLLESYTPFDELEALHVKQLFQFLASTDNAYCRSNLFAHIVADALILNEDFSKMVMLNHCEHAKEGITVWLNPGGHCDGNPDTYAGALREAEEETGLTNLRPLCNGLFDVNVGLVPAIQKPHGLEPQHLHFNICYAFMADDAQPLQISDESTDLQWVPVESLTRDNIWKEHSRRLDKLKQRWNFS